MNKDILNNLLHSDEGSRVKDEERSCNLNLMKKVHSDFCLFTEKADMINEIKKEDGKKKKSSNDFYSFDIGKINIKNNENCVDNVKINHLNKEFSAKNYNNVNSSIARTRYCVSSTYSHNHFDKSTAKNSTVHTPKGVIAFPSDTASDSSLSFPFSSHSEETQKTYIPLDVQNFNPPKKAIIMEFDDNTSIRLIFGDLPLEEREITQISKFKIFLKKVNFKCENTIFENDRYLLRFLQGNDWNMKVCHQDMLRHLKWRESNIPVNFNSVSHLLKKGYCYIHGRDRCRRPVIIFRCKEFEMSNPDDVLRVLIYWLEFSLKHLLVENKIEQWEVICDLSGCSAYCVPISVLKDITISLNRNYRGRLSCLHIINSPTLFSGIWRIVSFVLPHGTKKKIHFASPKNLIECIHPNQLEERFGGLQPNATRFDVPTLPLEPYD